MTVIYTLLHHKRYEEIMSALQIPQVIEFIDQCRINYKEHIDQMSSDRITKKS
jgi:hypothetical protein